MSSTSLVTVCCCNCCGAFIASRKSQAVGSYSTWHVLLLIHSDSALWPLAMVWHVNRPCSSPKANDDWRLLYYHMSCTCLDRNGKWGIPNYNTERCHWMLPKSSLWPLTSLQPSGSQTFFTLYQWKVWLCLYETLKKSSEGLHCEAEHVMQRREFI